MTSEDLRFLRPCGLCVALVPADIGCEHWKPHMRLKGPDSPAERSRRYAARKRAGLGPARKGAPPMTREERAERQAQRELLEQQRAERKANGLDPLLPEERAERKKLNAKYAADARERARVAVAEFRRAMNRKVTG